MRMPDMKGVCGTTVEVKVFRNGHSFACERYGRRCVRYWKPEPTIENELADYCRHCGKAKGVES